MLPAGDAGMSVFNAMQPGAVLFSHLFRRNDFATQVGKSNKLLLDRLQPLIPLSASDLSICSLSTIAPRLIIQPLNISDLLT